VSFLITFQGKRVEYFYSLYCKKGFGARPSSAISLDLVELAQKISGSGHFRLRKSMHNYIVLEHDETTISIMRNGEIILEQVPRGDPREVERMISEIFSDLESKYSIPPPDR